MKRENLITGIKEEFSIKLTEAEGLTEESADAVNTGQAHHFSSNQAGLFDITIKPMTRSDNPIAIFAGEADIFSILADIPYPAIVCDTDDKLLNFINEQKQFLLEIFENKFLEGEDFSIIKKDIKKFFYDKGLYLEFLRRKEILGSQHFLANETRYLKCMLTLKEHGLETININLLNKDQQQNFIKVLNDKNVTIHHLYLANQPDQDAQNNLRYFIKKLLFHRQALITWIVDDIARNNTDESDEQYLFAACGPSQFEQIAYENVPKFFADKDFLYDCLKDKEQAYEDKEHGAEDEEHASEDSYKSRKNKLHASENEHKSETNKPIERFANNAVLKKIYNKHLKRLRTSSEGTSEGISSVATPEQLRKKYKIVTCMAQQQEMEREAERISAIQRLNEECNKYQLHLLKAIDEFRTYEIEIIRKVNQSNNLEVFIQDRKTKETKALNESDKLSKSDKDKINLIVNKVNTVYDMQKILYNKKSPIRKLNEFKAALSSQKDIITKHRDVAGIRFLKNAGFILANILPGAGIFAAYELKGNFRFWKSHGELFVNKLEQEFETIKPILPSN